MGVQARIGGPKLRPERPASAEQPTKSALYVPREVDVTNMKSDDDKGLKIRGKMCSSLLESAEGLGA